MGYPLRSTAIYSLFSQLLLLQKNLRITEDGVSFYHKNVISILRHSFIAKHFPAESQQLVCLINEKNLIYTRAEILGTEPLFSLIFKGIETPKAYPFYLKSIFAACLELYPYSEDEEKEIRNDEKLEKEFLYHLYITISRFDDLLQEKSIIPGIDVMSRLLRKHIDNISVPFYGEPLKGLQVMGILETRTLDFENLIFLSFNEGVFPKAAPINSFIPHNLRYGFGLPTIEHQDAIFAYHFYRMIQRAKNVWMIYDASNSGMKRGEISRYFSQLKYIYDTPVNERNQSYKVVLSKPKPIVINKDDQVLEKLAQYSTKGSKTLSASALNNYIDCKLKFYFQKVEGIKEVEELKEDVDNSTFGTIFHSVVEMLYQPYENAELTKDILYQIKQNTRLIDKRIQEAFAEFYYKSEQIQELKGRQLIISRIIKKYVRQLITVDMEQCPFTYRKGEQEVKQTLKINDDLAVNFIGFIDRIDEIQGKTRIVDYKTGKSKKMAFKDIPSLMEDDPKRPAPVFQTFFYAWMYAQMTGNKNLYPSVYFIRDLYKDFNPYIFEEKIKIDDFEPYADEFEDSLKHLIEEIYNPKIAFTQTENEDKCRFCDFKDICLK